LSRFQEPDDVIVGKLEELTPFAVLRASIAESHIPAATVAVEPLLVPRRRGNWANPQRQISIRTPNGKKCKSREKG